MSLVMHSVRGLEPSAKLTLAVMADCANIKDHGVTFPSVHTLCERVGIHDRRTMQRMLRDLEKAGWLVVEQASKGGFGKTTRYRLNLPKMRAAAYSVPRENGGPQPAGYSGAQPADNGGPQPAEVNPTLVTTTAGQKAINRGLQPARSFEPEFNRKGNQPSAIGDVLRDAIKGNRKPTEKDEGQPQPEKPAGRPTAAPMSQAEQIAYAEKHARKA